MEQQSGIVKTIKYLCMDNINLLLGIYSSEGEVELFLNQFSSIRYQKTVFQRHKLIPSGSLNDLFLLLTAAPWNEIRIIDRVLDRLKGDIIYFKLYET